MGEQAALDAVATTGIEHRVIRHGPVRSLAEAADARGVEPRDVVKTLVVRRGVDDYLFVLVPGDRTISWPKLRTFLGVSRLSMPDADERICGREVTLGGGAHGVAIAMSADDVVHALHAAVADVTDEEG